jgi:hypothetical protein
MHDLFLVLFLLLTKHLIVDYPLQAFPYQYKNKGTYGHPGGLLHSGLHLLATFAILFFVTDIQRALLLAVADGVIHYHIDWAKMNINAKMGWGPTTHEEFWILTGIDQYFHLLTYVWILWEFSR